MANPIPNEDKLYQILKEEGVKVHPIVWELLDHHIRNDLFGITAIVEDAYDRKESLTDREKDIVLKRVKNISSVMRKIQEATGWDGRYYHDIKKKIK